MNASYRTEITNEDDVIDSRDVIARIAELEALYEDPEYQRSESEFGEYLALIRLASEGADRSEDWEYGATLIRDSYFVEYAKELADDLGLPAYAKEWPFRCIDWEKAAWELQSDYTAIDFGGVTYWIR